MIRFVFRFFGLLLLALAFILFVYDGTKSVAGNAIFISKVSDVWAMVHQSSLIAVRSAVEHGLPKWLWDPAFPALLAAPSWLPLALVAIFLILIGRKKKPLIGYARS